MTDSLDHILVALKQLPNISTIAIKDLMMGTRMLNILKTKKGLNRVVAIVKKGQSDISKVMGVEKNKVP